MKKVVNIVCISLCMAVLLSGCSMFKKIKRKKPAPVTNTTPVVTVVKKGVPEKYESLYLLLLSKPETIDTAAIFSGRLSNEKKYLVEGYLPSSGGLLQPVLVVIKSEIMVEIMRLPWPENPTAGSRTFFGYVFRGYSLGDESIFTKQTIDSLFHESQTGFAWRMRNKEKYEIVASFPSAVSGTFDLLKSNEIRVSSTSPFFANPNPGGNRVDTTRASEKQGSRGPRGRG